MSHAWFSDYSICYLELGSLGPGRVRPNGSVGNPRGEICVFLGYDWLVQSASAKFVRLDLHEDKAERDALFARIIGATVASASLCEDGLEIELRLSTGLTLQSVSTDDDGPDWGLGFHGELDGWLVTKNGSLQFKPNKAS